MKKNVLALLLTVLLCCASQPVAALGETDQFGDLIPVPALEKPAGLYVWVRDENRDEIVLRFTQPDSLTASTYPIYIEWDVRVNNDPWIFNRPPGIHRAESEYLVQYYSNTYRDSLLPPFKVIELLYGTNEKTNSYETDPFDARWLGLDTWDTEDNTYSFRFRYVYDYAFFDMASDTWKRTDAVSPWSDTFVLGQGTGGSPKQPSGLDAPADSGAPPYRGASSWATAELDRAARYGLITSRIRDNMSGQVTREEFAEIAVRLYEKYTGKAASAGNTAFADTSNPEILKAASLGLVSGIGGNRFDPEALITREQMAAIMLRVLKVLNPAGDFSAPVSPDFADDARVSSWARDGVYYCAGVGIVAGAGNNLYNPKGDATREQAVIVCTRAYELYTGSQMPDENAGATSQQPHKAESLAWPAADLPGVPVLDGVIVSADITHRVQLEIKVDNADVVRAYLEVLKSSGFEAEAEQSMDEDNIFFMGRKGNAMIIVTYSPYADLHWNVMLDYQVL